MIYTVGEMAKKLKVNASTLRYYDKEGLLPFVKRSEGGVRMFTDDSLPWLEMIQCLKKIGMPIKEIKHYLDCCEGGDSKIDERYAIVKLQREVVLSKIEELKGVLDILNYSCWSCELAKKNGTADESLNSSDIPREYYNYVNKQKNKDKTEENK